MGQDPSPGGTAMTDAKGAAQLQSEIEETRRQLGDTVEALAEKTNVKAQAKLKLAEAKASLAGRRDKLLSKVNGASLDQGRPDTSQLPVAAPPPAAAFQLPAAASQLPRKARELPAGVLAAATFAAGFAAGRLTNR
jgi:Protein of unknown function (DUF3618)